ncbi:MAG: amino acid ABC transporter permease [Rhodospirillaceae bacterium]|nr:amino acid ABC transporter permease [Rhodospirillaceae bacterium]
MAEAAVTGSKPDRVAILNDPRWRSIIFQVVALVLVITIGWYLVTNTQANMEKRNIGFGLDFLSIPAGFDIIQTLIPYTSSSSYSQAFFVSLINTLLVAIVGIFFATILGFIAGVARLSSNWLIKNLAAVYVEVFRNVPLLLQIFFWYHAVLKTLPGPRQSLSMLEIFFLNNRGVYLPGPQPQGSFWIICALLVGAVITMVVWKKREDRRQELTGERRDLFGIGLGLILVLPMVAFVVIWQVAGTPLTWDIPTLRGFNFGGGIEILPELLSLVIALSVYTGAFIAENVRSGIQAVSRGQTEAAFALGIRPGPTMRLIIIPQALRVIIPPLTSQYLNLTKNSSLAVAIAYPDLVAVFMGTTLNQTGRAVEIVGITMGIYLLLSLLTSVIMNWYNARVALVER